MTSYGFGDNFGIGSYHSGGGPGNASMSRDSSNEWTRLSQAISKNIQSITQNVAQMQRMVSQIGTQQDSPQLRDKLHQVQHYTNQLAKETSNYIKDISHLSQPASQSDQRQRKMQKERLVNEFTTALNNFQGAQRQAAEKEKASVTRARASSGYDPFFDERKSDDNLTDKSGVGVPLPPMDSQMQSSIQMEQDVDMDLLQEREQAIRKLESDIVDVNGIFKDLALLVHEQGDMIDSIEECVNNASVHVEQGRDQLYKAKEYQSKTRRKKFICIIILVLVLVIVATIIGVVVSNKN